MLGRIAQTAHQQLSSKVIAITDKPTAPPAQYSDIALLCQTSGLVYYNSMTSPISLVTILVSMIAMRREGKYPELQKRLAGLSSLSQDYRTETAAPAGSTLSVPASEWRRPEEKQEKT